MRVCETVIVTVRLMNRAFDMELPTFLSIKELIEKIDETLHSMPASIAPDMHCVGLVYEGKQLESERTLANYGIWDGSFVDCLLNGEVAGL